LDDFIERLKQRKLVQWSLAYVAAAFALIQVLDIVAQRFGWPEQTIRVVIVVLGVGFFVAIVLAWYHGERGRQQTSGVELLLLALVLAIGGAVVWRLAPGKPEAALAATKDASAGTGSAAAPPADPHSIAVLPFVNMSGDKDNEYFSDGVSEELLNVLARIPELQVAARTSSFSFKGDKKEAPEIAQALHVRMLLEGSVRKQGGTVRITAQLIDASRGYHVWSNTYERELKDIFAIQDEIANAIAGELKVKIVGADGSSATSAPHNVDAYDFYLRGLALWQMRGEANLWQATEQFEHAAALDPQFAGAFAGLAITYIILPDYSVRIHYDESTRRARDNAERALALDPALPEPYIVLGYLADGERGRAATAQALYRRAIAIRPSFASAYQWLGNSLWGRGSIDAGIEMLERASVLDPRSAIIANNHALALISAGRYAEANALCEPILKAIPDSALCLESTFFATLLLGDLGEARKLTEHFADVNNPHAREEVRLLFDALEGHGDRHAVAARLATFLPQSAYDPTSGNLYPSYIIPTLLVLLGEPRLALANLQAWAYTDKAGQSEWATAMLALGPLHCDPEFVALVKRIDSSDPHYATLCAAKH